MQPAEQEIEVSIPAQRLDLLAGTALRRSYPISTSAYGLGSEPNSLKTPLGRFRICEKIGAGAPPGTVFRGREPTGEIGLPETEEDLVTTRILWLDGLETDNANTRDRYIYIHGTNHESQIGEPASHGCIRMRNVDIIELFDLVEAGTPVLIRP